MATDRDVEVPDPDHPRIVIDDLVGGEPHLRGRRLTVLDIFDGATRDDPTTVATRYDLAVADVYAALAYYHAHEDEMVRHRRKRAKASDEIRRHVQRERPPGVEPPS